MKSHVNAVLSVALIVTTMVHSTISASENVTYRYCKDIPSFGNVSSVTLTNCSSSDSACVLHQNSSEPARLNTVYYTTEKSYTARALSLRLLGQGVSIDLLNKDIIEVIHPKIDYSIGVNFTIPDYVTAGKYSLQLQRKFTCPGDPSTELCIEIDVLIPGGDDSQCNPDECIEKGYCTEYSRCVKDPNSGLGSWNTLNCSQDLFWNPEARNSSEHGGTCDFFLNLSPKLQDEYKNDTKCIPPCEWWEDGQCSPTYKYRKPFDNKTLLGRELTLSCPTDPTGSPQLLWNQATYTCDRCSNVKNNDTGTPCPC